MKIREAVTDDICELVQLEKKCFPVNLQLTYHSFYQTINLTTHLLLVLEDKKQIISYIKVVPRKTIFRIESVATKKEFQKQGYSKKLIKYVLKNYGDNATHRLCVNCKQKHVILLYEKLGFKIKGKKLDYYSKDVHAYLMERTSN